MPYPWEKVTKNTFMFQHGPDVIDGVSFGVMIPVCQQALFQPRWVLSNSKGPSFELAAMLNNSNGNPR